MMMMKTPLLFFFLLLSSSASPLYPSIRFGQRDTSILMKLPDPQRAELRYGRHADAIFTNSYRKVLGQISARKFLQTIMGKRIRDESESLRRRSNEVIEADLTSIHSKSSFRGHASRILS